VIDLLAELSINKFLSGANSAFVVAKSYQNHIYLSRLFLENIQFFCIILKKPSFI